MENGFFLNRLADNCFLIDDGKVYIITGAGKLRIVELNEDVSGIKPGGLDQTLIENASLPSGNKGGLSAEGSQLFKVNGKYYLFNITWPRGSMRTEIIHRRRIKLPAPMKEKWAYRI